MIRLDVMGSIRTATKFFGEWTLPYYNSRPVHIMTTSRRWSIL